MPLLTSFPAAFAAASLSLIAIARSAGAAAPASDMELERQFTSTVQPFLQTYCVSCHGKEKTEAELDLSPFPTVSSVVDGFAHWELVLERLDAGEMPPDKAKQHPTEASRQEILAWIHALRKSEAAKNAGDPRL
jgi:hypothetical protein